MNAFPTGASVLLGILVGAYCFFCPRLNNAIYEPVLFHPHKNAALETMTPTSIEGAVAERVEFTSEKGRPLIGWYYQKPGAKFTILFNHGNGGDLTYRIDLVELLNKAGASVFIYDYEGYGASPGKPSVSGICEDGVGAYKFLSETKGVNPSRIILYGESLGTGVASYLSTRFPSHGIILQSGFSSLHRIATEHFWLLNIYPESFFPEPHLNSLAVMSKPHSPLLVIHGQLDTTVPVAHADSLYQHALPPKSIELFPRTAHSNFYTTAPDHYVDVVRNFLDGLPE